MREHVIWRRTVLAVALQQEKCLQLILCHGRMDRRQHLLQLGEDALRFARSKDVLRVDMSRANTQGRPTLTELIQINVHILDNDVTCKCHRSTMTSTTASNDTNPTLFRGSSKYRNDMRRN